MAVRRGGGGRDTARAGGAGLDTARGAGAGLDTARGAGAGLDTARGGGAGREVDGRRFLWRLLRVRDCDERQRSRRGQCDQGSYARGVYAPALELFSCDFMTAHK